MIFDKQIDKIATFLLKKFKLACVAFKSKFNLPFSSEVNLGFVNCFCKLAIFNISA